MWQFWIDVGGTFTDCIGVDPEGQLHQHKTLSSGFVQGLVHAGSSASAIIDPARQQDPQGFWNSARLTVLSDSGQPIAEAQVTRFEAAAGRLELEPPGLHLTGQPATVISIVPGGTRYRLDAGIPAPVLAIRWLLRLRANEACPAVRLRFGTTRGTNALLTRTAARTVLITTEGFGDVPLIGNQTRPDLFARDIRKPQPLFSHVLEVRERLSADGQVLIAFPLTVDQQKSTTQPADLEPPPSRSNDQVSMPELVTDAESLRKRLSALRQGGFQSVAICLMHSYANEQHEQLIERTAGAAGFTEISRSAEVSPLIRFIPRCDTTTLDACLNPVLRVYLNELQQLLPESDILVMTSTGGLVRSSRFRGRDCLLSGPAGGIVGFSRVAASDGYTRAIGFDMGGTSTDVARFDGCFEYQNESTKAGVRIMTPVLAIETIAAGGGSVCGFDGVRLFVGPDSAGADPGPACYGAGGPLTVTDLNVFLGRILPEEFPFPLDVATVRRRLTALAVDMAAAGAAPTDLSLATLAAGLIGIANDNMVRAIRRVSVAKGYDPSEYILVCFGGAGGLHACSVARCLRIPHVLLHPFAGILSAWGAGQADIRAHRQHGVWQPLSQSVLQQLHPVLLQLAGEAEDEVTCQGIPPDHLQQPEFRVELRYVGTDNGIVVRQPNGQLDLNVQQLRASFEQQHRSLYGYIHSGRTIEIVCVHVESVGASSADNARQQSAAIRRQSAAIRRQSAAIRRQSAAIRRQSTDQQTTPTTSVWFGDEQLTAIVLQSAELDLGESINGPAVICEATSTFFLEPGCTATVTATGALLIDIPLIDSPLIDIPLIDSPLTTDPSDESATTPGAIPAAVQLELFSNQFSSIAEQMGEMLRRTAVSTNVRERLDFSCALFDADGRLVVNAPHVPVHLGAMSETVRAVMADHPQMQPGDVYVTNDPFRGGSHLPDITVVTPVFADDNATAPAFFTASRAHHAEIGGIVPGSMPPFSRTLSEEGILIQSQKLVHDGHLLEIEMRQLLSSGPYPSRSVYENLMDLTAQVAANACGARLLQQLAERNSSATVTRMMRQLQSTSAEKIRRALRGLGMASGQFIDHMDDGTVICANIRIDGDQAVVDFSGSGPVHPGNLNANTAITTAAILYTLRCLLQEDIPLNAGVLDPVRLIVPSGILNPLAGPTTGDLPAVVGGNVETSQRIVDVLFGCLQLAAASQGTMNNLTFGNSQFGYYETICGGAGATPDTDGADAVHTHMTNTRLTDPEILEQRYPVRVRQFRIRRGSGGCGRHRGGNGVLRELEFLQSVTVSLLSQRRTVAPWGMQGGLPGQCGRNLLRPNPESEFLDIGGCFSGPLDAGAILRIETPGGGGWGAREESANRI